MYPVSIFYNDTFNHYSNLKRNILILFLFDTKKKYLCNTFKLQNKKMKFLMLSSFKEELIFSPLSYLDEVFSLTYLI